MSSGLRHMSSKLVWVIMALLMLGLGGFGVSNFGGSISRIGSVGGRDIPVNDYALALRSEMTATSQQIGQNLTMEQARGLGIPQRVQAQLFTAATFDNEADHIGLSVGDAEVLRRITAMNAFHGVDGSFNRDTYKMVLQQNGLTETRFEAAQRTEAARALLQGALVSATAAPADFVASVTAWAHQKRDFTVGRIAASDLAEPVPAPTETEIKAWYDAHPEAYTRPETRRITYIWLTPEMLKDKVEIDEKALRDAYEARKSEYVTPELRMVERLVYPSDAEAGAAKARLDKGEATFETLVNERGLTLADIDLGEVTEADLGAAGAAVFALTEPGVVGPLPSDLGPALFAMNGIIAAKDITFEDAQDDLRQGVALDRARRQILDETNGISDLLASGASLEEVAGETGMEVGTVAYNSESEDGIVGYESFRKVADAVTADSFPEIADLEDGGIFALRLDGIDAPAVKPLSEVHDKAIDDWHQNETRERLQAMADDAAVKIAAGAGIDSLGLITTAYKGLVRNSYIDGISPAVLQQIFEMAPGTTATFADGDVFHVVSMTTVMDADPADPELAQSVAQLDAQASQSLAGDVLQLFTEALQSDAKITVDQTAIEAVQAQLQ